MNNIQQDLDLPMSKEQMLEAMRNGKKVTHDYFTSDEYIYLKDGKIVSEDGVTHDFFWLDRKGSNWETGWRIFNG